MALTKAMTDGIEGFCNERLQTVRVLSHTSDPKTEHWRGRGQTDIRNVAISYTDPQADIENGSLGGWGIVCYDIGSVAGSDHHLRIKDNTLTDVHRGIYLLDMDGTFHFQNNLLHNNISVTHNDVTVYPWPTGAYIVGILTERVTTADIDHNRVNATAGQGPYWWQTAIRQEAGGLFSIVTCNEVFDIGNGFCFGLDNPWTIWAKNRMTGLATLFWTVR